MALVLLLAVGTPAASLASKVTVTTDPPGATVQLDGVAVGVSPVTITKVAPGTHLLKVAKEGYTTREDSIDVDGDSDFQIHAPLNPAPKFVDTPKPAPKPEPEPRKDPPPPPPKLEPRLVLVVEAAPAEALVQIVGQPDAKRVPATFTGLSPGVLRLVVSAPGYQDRRVEIDLKQDSRTRVVLDPVP